jgi:hypothetical protein
MGSNELPDCAKGISHARNTTIGPTGVIIDNGTSDNTSPPYEELNADRIITQTLEGYVLPLLPAVPLHIHNIHLKCKTIAWDTDYYSELRLPSYRQNIGKYQVLWIDNIPVYYIPVELLIYTPRIVRIHLDFKQTKIE